MKKGVGFDLDGVLVPLEEYIAERGIPYFRKKAEEHTSKRILIHNKIKKTSSEEAKKRLENQLEKYSYEFSYNPEFYRVPDIFDDKESAHMKFWMSNIVYYCLYYKAREYASEIVKFCITNNLDPYLITARVYVIPEYDEDAKMLEKLYKQALAPIFRAMVFSWLKRMNIPIPKKNIIFCREEGSPQEKAAACKSHNVITMFEDKNENIPALSEVTDVVLFDASYNSQIAQKETSEDEYGIKRISHLREGKDYLEQKILRKKIYIGGYHE